IPAPAPRAGAAVDLQAGPDSRKGVAVVIDDSARGHSGLADQPGAFRLVGLVRPIGTLRPAVSQEERGGRPARPPKCLLDRADAFPAMAKLDASQHLASGLELVAGLVAHELGEYRVAAERDPRAVLGASRVNLRGLPCVRRARERRARLGPGFPGRGLWFDGRP